MNTKKVANNIKVARIKSGLDVQEVSKTLGITPAAYYNYEKNADRVKISLLIKLSELYNCKIKDFFS